MDLKLNRLYFFEVVQESENSIVAHIFILTGTSFTEVCERLDKSLPRFIHGEHDTPKMFRMVRTPDTIQEPELIGQTTPTKAKE